MNKETAVEVSVIIPVYNTGDYLKTSVESVLKQKNCRFELILIDDGSKDSSGELCDKYAETDSRVRVCHKENAGLSAARNTALEMAKGEYVTFFDHDDEYLENLLCDNYRLAKLHDADVVRFDRLKRTFLPNGKILEDISGTTALCKSVDPVVLRHEEIQKHFAQIQDSGVLYGIWNGMYRRKLIEENRLRFEEDIRFGGEDWIYNYQLLAAAESYVFNPKTYYIYNRRIGYSTSSKFHENRIEAILRTDEVESSLLQRWNYDEIDKLRHLQSKFAYVLEIVGIYNHPDCPYSSSQKNQCIRNAVNQIRLKEYFDKNLLKGISKKRRLCAFLIKHNVWWGLRGLDKLKGGEY